MNKKLLVSVLIFFFIFSSCSADKKDWKMAESVNTIPAYENFLKQYPQGDLADKARLRLEKLYNERHPAFRNKNKVKIVIDESSDSTSTRFPFRIYAWELCKYAGLVIVSDYAKDYDVTLKIQVEVFGIRSQYRSINGTSSGRFYTGAGLSGTISLEIPDVDPYKKSFGGKKSPPTTITSRHATRPSHAPFDELFKKSNFLSKLLEIMGEFYGTNTLINIFTKESDPYVLIKTAEVMGEIKDPRTVEPLIDALRNKRIQLSVAKALKKITGEYFSTNQKKWHEWWMQNKEKFQKKEIKSES